MATIASTTTTGNGQRTATETTMTASDTLVYQPGKGQLLILRNATGGPLSPVIDGAGSTTVPVAGIGNIDVSGGYAVGAIATTVVKVIPLDTISAYLKGTITITGGTGLIATLLTQA